MITVRHTSFRRIIAYVALIHILCLLFLTVCRGIFVYANAPAEGIDRSLLLRAMLIGVKFDNLIVSYANALPLLVLTLFTVSAMHTRIFPKIMPALIRTAAWFYGIVYAILLFAHIADIRYFRFFDNHINIGITEWFGFVGETAGLVFDDKGNYIYMALALFIIIVFALCLRGITRRFTGNWQQEKPQPTAYLWMTTVLIVLYGIMFCGLRGSFQRYPLRVSMAYFCDKPFYNKLGINPVFNFIKSADGKNTLPPFLSSISEEEALLYVQHELAFQPTDTLHPLNRKGEPHPLVEGKLNVVLVFMESMSAYNLERKENGEWLTPYLRSLRDKSICWTNAFSTGIHTNNGIVGVHYGFVPDFAKTSMGSVSDHYTGLPYFLKQAGYQNLCFVTGNPQYDNMNSFWRENHIDRIYSLYDYPAEKAVNNFGVQDDYMFSFGLERLDELSKEGKPFFASFLTVSNHDPFVVPEAYRHRANEPKDRIIAYADDALKQFMDAAEQTEWGKNTVFVLVADHGTILPTPYDMVLSYNTIPVFFYSRLLTPMQISQPASQIDITPTLLSMLGIDYQNNSLGIDILNDTRRYAFFVSDSHLGVSDGEYFYCYNLQTQAEYLYRTGRAENLLQQMPRQAAEMREYGMKMQRVNLMAIQKKWTEPCE